MWLAVDFLAALTGFSRIPLRGPLWVAAGVARGRQLLDRLAEFALWPIPICR
jgi:hypothetical protein